MHFPYFFFCVSSILSQQLRRQAIYPYSPLSLFSSLLSMHRNARKHLPRFSSVFVLTPAAANLLTIFFSFSARNYASALTSTISAAGGDKFLFHCYFSTKASSFLLPHHSTTVCHCHHPPAQSHATAREASDSSFCAKSLFPSSTPLAHLQTMVCH